MSATSMPDTGCTIHSGTATAVADGGNSPYTYVWSTNPVQSSQTATGLSGETLYTVTATDMSGCTSTTVVFVEAASLAVVIVEVTHHIACDGGGTGTITAAVDVGTPPYSFLWSNGATTETITGLITGTYTLTVSDAGGCQEVVSAVVLYNPGVLMLMATITESTSCTQPDGTITLVVEGGSPPYDYIWSNGSTTNVTTGLAWGSYEVTVTDVFGCTATQVYFVRHVNLPRVEELSVMPNTNCDMMSNGSATIIVNGGTPPYQYSWTNLQHLILQSGPENTITGLSAESYLVEITDSESCTILGTFSIVNQHFDVSATSSPQTDCIEPNGSIDVTASGGTPPYLFFWGEPGVVGNNPTGLSSGTYTVTVLDVNACEASTEVEVGGGKSQLQVLLVLTHVSCSGANDGTIDLTASGGTPPYSIFWSTGDFSEDIDSLSPGLYSVTVTDFQGCEFITSTTIFDDPAIDITLQVMDESAPGAMDGVIGAIVSGGSPPYTLQWSNGSSASFISGLGAGIYTVTVTDSEGCQSIQSAELGAVAVESPRRAHHMIVYPNPSTGRVTFELHLTQPHEVLIEWMDLNGRVIMSDRHSPIQDLQSEVDLSSVTRGLYFVRVQFGHTHLIKKVLILQ